MYSNGTVHAAVQFTSVHFGGCEPSLTVTGETTDFIVNISTLKGLNC